MNPVTGLSLGRIVVGAVSLRQAGLAAGMFGLDVANNPQGPYLARLFGSREIALGTATLLARGTTRRNLVLAGIGVDAGRRGHRRARASRTSPCRCGPARCWSCRRLGAVLSGFAGLRTQS